MPARPRPLSPHLEIYRWQIGNTLSILHRATGIALAFGLVALSFWLVSLAGGEDSYRTAYRAFASRLGLFNGLRHLFWDVGWGFERRQRHASGWFAVVGAVASTAALWALLWRCGRL
jgi:succinate dehydrogenase / fumarate reductase cytochrome b subunit